MKLFISILKQNINMVIRMWALYNQNNENFVIYFALPNRKSEKKIYGACLEY